jgi:HSP20 family protein
MRIITPFLTTRTLGSDMWSDMDLLFDEFSHFSALPSYDERQFDQQFGTATEFVEENEHYMLSVDMPGLKKDDIKIEVQENTLNISGERKRETLPNKNVQRAEKFYGQFKRSYTLPNIINADQIEAHYQDGVLQILMPKAPAAQAKKIEIQTGKSGFFDKLLNVKKSSQEQKEVTSAQKN